MNKRKTSQLWKYFEPENENYAICNMCKLRLSYKTSISNLKKHLKTKHPTVTILTPAEVNAHNKIL